MTTKPIEYVPQGINPLDPNSAALAKALMLAQFQQQQGQQMMQDGSQGAGDTQFVPSGGQYVPAQAVKQSPFAAAARGGETMLGALMQKKAFQKQIDLQTALMQSRMNMLNQAFGGAPSPQQLGSALSGNQPPAASGVLGHIADNVPGQPLNIPRGSQTASMMGVGTPPQEQNVSVPGATVGGMPLSGAANTAVANELNNIERSAHPPMGANFDPRRYMMLQMADPSAAEAYLKANGPQAPTNEQLNAQASGFQSPYAMSTQEEMNKALIAQGKNPMGAPAQTTQGQTAPSQPLLETPGQLAGDKKLAENKADATAEAAKTLNVTQANLPVALQRFQQMRDYAKNASSGYGVNNEGNGWAQEFWNQAGGDTATANSRLKQLEAQGILPELGPALTQAGIKGNKFLESLSSNASGLDLAASPDAKLKLINGLESQYINNLKSAAAQVRANGQSAPSEEDIDALVAQHRKGLNLPAQQQQTAQQPQYNEGMTATNPKTGQKIMFKGGQWVQAQ